MSEQASMKDVGKPIENAKGYSIYQWTGPRVTSGEMKPFSVSPRGSFDWKYFASLEDARAYLATAGTVRVANVSLEVVIPADATEDQIEEWIEYELHFNGSISTTNPLHEHALEARDVYIESITDQS